MAKVRILAVDDEEALLGLYRETLAQIPDTEIILEQRSRRAAERLASESFDLLLADIRMPELDGVELLHIARRHDPSLVVLLITAFPSVETAVESIKLGAAEYLTKPFLPDHLLTTVRGLLREKRLREENRTLERQADQAFCFDEIIGESAAMRAVYEAIDRVAESNVDVLIIGETGTGKELVARSIQKRSRLAGGRFVAVDCGAIPENLLESEFFGHERGSFTGAYGRSLGFMEVADGGTLLLDEVGGMPLPLQAKLLRALQERKFRRVGGRDEIAVNVRVVAASNRDLAEEVRAHRFREDLYYRLNVGRIEIPPLRERVEDIPALVARFVDRYTREMEKPAKGVRPEVLEVLMAYSWPGNVRELQNVVKRALVMSRDSALSADDLPDEIVTQAVSRPPGTGAGFFHLRAVRVAAFEREYLVTLLKSWEGDVPRAAQDARLPRGTLYRLLKKHDLAAEDFRRTA